jgi:hypothetical protein
MEIYDRLFRSELQLQEHGTSGDCLQIRSKYTSIKCFSSYLPQDIAQPVQTTQRPGLGGRKVMTDMSLKTEAFHPVNTAVFFHQQRRRNNTKQTANYEGRLLKIFKKHKK